MRGTVKDVPAGFVTVETRGFNRNEKGTDIGLDYRKKEWSWGVSSTDTDIAYRTVASDNTIRVKESKFENQRAYVNFNSEKGLDWSLEHNRTHTNYQSSDTKIDSTALSASKQFGRLNTRLSVEHQSGIGPISFASSSTPQVGKLSLDAVRLLADYSTPNGWFFGARTSLTSTKTLGKSGTGNDYTLSASFRPGTGPFEFEAVYAQSDSGSLSTLGTFQNGTGIGYGGNGFSSGGVTGNYITGASDYRFLQFLPNYRVGNRAVLNGRFYQSKSSGIYNSNAETTSYGLGLALDLGNGTLLTTSVDKSKTNFLEVGTASDSLALDAAIMGNPKGPWSYRLGFNSLISGNSTSFAQDSFGYDGYLRFKINRKSNTGFQFAFGRTSGYLPQSDNYFSAFYEHQLYQNVSLVGSYKFRKVSNLDSSLTSGAYRSNGFDLELNFNFGG